VGYFAGYALEAWIGRLKSFQIAFLMVALVGLGLAWLLVQSRRR
jgi:hypothetical protein